MMSAGMEKGLKEYRKRLVEKIAAIDLLLDDSSSLSKDAAVPIPRGGRNKAIADAIFPIVQESGEMRREAILAELESAGVYVRGETVEKKLATLSSVLSKDARFKSLGRSTGLWAIDNEHIARGDRVNGQHVMATEKSSRLKYVTTEDLRDIDSDHSYLLPGQSAPEMVDARYRFVVP